MQDRDRGQTHELEVVHQGGPIGIPLFQGALVGGCHMIVDPFGFVLRMGEDGLLIAEEQRADSGEPRAHFANGHLLGFGVQGEMGGHHRARPDEAHLPQPHIEELGKLVDLGLPEEAPEGQHPRVPMLGDEPARKVGAVLEHGGEFEDHERFPVPADPLLLVEDVVFPGTFQDEHDREKDRQQDENGDAGQCHVKKSGHDHILPSRYFPVSR